MKLYFTRKFASNFYIVKVVYPLKQGLKHIKFRVIDYIFLVKVVYPLKQGLKLHYELYLHKQLTYVKVVYPLKQGLKLRK